MRRDVTDLRLETAITTLLDYCRAKNWAGHDPYDALNSKLFTATPVLNHRIPRLIITQALKRSPVNLRGLLLVPKMQNPKALALCLSALLKSQRRGARDFGADIESLIARLEVLRSPEERYSSWGYSFPWQTRTVVVPAGAPNLVCTSFVAGALLDAYEQRCDRRCLEMAQSAAAYILDELYWEEGDVAAFAYPLSSVNTPVHNANLLAAALLCRVYHHTGEERFLGPALKAARYSARKQQPDGSWYYGEASSQRWIDNFHTGYNLCSLHSIREYTGTAEFTVHLAKGFRFYRERFFREDGAPKYFHDHAYPIDVHSVAQSILTLTTLEKLDAGNLALARSVYDWAMKHLWDDRGFFYYRVLRTCTIRTSYMRWSQAWMLLAMTSLQEAGAQREITYSTTGERA